MPALAARHCRPYPPGTPPLRRPEAEALLPDVAGWELDGDGAALRRVFRFENYHQTLAFVNAVAWIAHAQDHHPEMTVSYNRCVIRYNTHTVGGLSENDFICAARINALLPTG